MGAEREREMCDEFEEREPAEFRLVILGSEGGGRERYHRSAETASSSFSSGTSADTRKTYSGCPCCPTSIVINDVGRPI